MLAIFRGGATVAQLAVNELVVGSNPTRGASDFNVFKIEIWQSALDAALNTTREMARGCSRTEYPSLLVLREAATRGKETHCGTDGVYLR